MFRSGWEYSEAGRYRMRKLLLAVCLTLLLCGGALAASLTIHAPEEAKQGRPR